MLQSGSAGLSVSGTMSLAVRPALQRYGLACVASVLAVLLELQIGSLIPSPFELLFTAVLVSAWYGGVGPGLLATAACGLASAWLFLPALSELMLMRLGTFLFFGAVISWAAAAVRRSQANLVTSLQLRSQELVATNARLEKHMAERQRTEAVLQAERNFVSAVLDTVGALVGVVDRDGRIVRFNRACEQALGYSAVEVLGRRFWDLLPVPDEIEPAKAVFEKLLVGEWPMEYDTYWFTRSGSRRFLRWSTTFLRDRDGAIDYVIGTGIDITERKRAEQKAAALLEVVRDIGGTLDLDELLRRVQARMSELVRCEVVATFYWDGVQRVSRMISHHGIAPHFAREIESLSFPADQPFVARLMDGHAVAINDLTQERWLPPELHTHFRVKALVVAPLVVRERVLGSLVACATRPRTFGPDHVQLCEAIARQVAVAIERADLYRAQQEEAAVSGALARVGQELISSLDTPVVLDRLCQVTTEVLGCDFSHTWMWQPQQQVYVAVSGHGDLPEQWESLRVLTLSRTLLAPMLEQLERDQIVNIDVSAFGGSTGVGEPLHAITGGLLVPLRRGGEILGLHTAGYRTRNARFTAQQERIARGIAQLASLALENARLVEELGRADRVKSEFVATMSHELRTPLNIITGYNDLLLEGEFDALTPAQTETVQRIGRSARQLLELINTTLDLSRLEAGRLPVEVHQIQLRDLTAEVAAETQELQENSGLQFVWHLGDAPLPLRTDALKLKVILKNLIGNAVKFTPHGTVTVEIGASDGGLAICVSDTGIGMSPEDVRIIFEPFRQAERSIGSRYGGVGLGLHIVQRLLTLLDGSITVTSEVGKGSTFRVWLPRELRQSGATAPYSTAAAQTRR